MPGAHAERAMQAVVADVHDAAPHDGQRAGAAVLGEPDRAADRRGRLPALRTERAVAAAPQAPDGLLALAAGLGDAGRARRAAGEVSAAQAQHGDGMLVPRLPEAEDG